MPFIRHTLPATATGPQLNLSQLSAELAERTITRPPLLMLHGYTAGAWMYETHYMPCLVQAGWTCFALDLRGHGNSNGHTTIHTSRYREYLSDVSYAAAFVEAQTGIPPILIGHSLGSVLARDYAATNSISGLVLMGFGDLKPAMNSFMSWMLKRFPLATLGGIITGRSSCMWAKFEPQYQVLFSGQSPESVRTYVSKFQRQPESDKIFMDLMGRKIPKKTRSNVPISIIAGDRDPAARAKSLAPLATGYGVTPSIIEGAAHDLCLGHYWKPAMAELQGWLEQHFPSS
ncbi:MAG: alpha/beta hydrolase [Phormidesmis sp.]